MIQIFCERPSAGARAIVNRIRELGGRARRIRTYTPGAFRWGRGGGNKYEELRKLHEAGVPVPAHSLEAIHWLDAVLEGARPPLGRTFQHTHARDLLFPDVMRADFFVEQIDTIREHRIHVFDGECVRVQTKQPTPGQTPHPWIRSASSGWTLVARPDLTALVPRGARTIAKQAVAALGYEFGAVDLAVKVGGGIVVWEVNTQPGMGDGTADVYARILMAKQGG